MRRFYEEMLLGLGFLIKQAICFSLDVTEVLTLAIMANIALVVAVILLCLTLTQ